MRAIILLLIPTLAACGDPVDDAVNRYAKASTAVERCVAADELSRAYMAKGDTQNGALWRTTSNSDCIVAENQSAATLDGAERAVEKAIENALAEAAPVPGA